MERVTTEYLFSKGFERHSDGFGWAKFRKDGFELVEIPLKKGGVTIAFKHEFCGQSKYKYPLKTSELAFLFKLLTGKEIDAQP